MNMARSDLDRIQKRQLARFERMGLTVRPMPDGLSLLVSLPLGPEPLDSVDSPILPCRVLFSSVGPNQIKCLRPRALFGLPLIDVRHCTDARSLESRIRQAWRERTAELRDTRKRLRELGLDVEVIGEKSALAFPLPGEAPNVKIAMQRLGEAILPSTGPLSGLPLEIPSDRVFEVSDCFNSGSNLECRLGQRIQELSTSRQQAFERRRVRGQIEAPPDLGPPPKQRSTPPIHQPKVLIVGPQLVKNDELVEEFERQGYRPHLCRNESDALGQLTSMSPDLVVSQYALGRSDGASLVQAILESPGIERIPVVLLDDVRNESRRQVARAVGAVGYLTAPIEAQRFVARLRSIVQEPADRRFTRYARRLAARLEGASQRCLITELGRGGVFITTPQILESQTSMRCKMAIPELGHALIFEGEVRYCADAQGSSRQGIGLRFFEMSSANESMLIDYLGLIESKA